jgi:hypothetical protein
MIERFSLQPDDVLKKVYHHTNSGVTIIVESNLGKFMSRLLYRYLFILYNNINYSSFGVLVLK